MILGRSLLKKTVYVDRVVYGPEVRALIEKGYEVVELGGKPVALALKSPEGLCSGPTQWSARHCFGSPIQDVKGKKYVIAGHDVEGHVTKDYSPPLFNIIKTIAYFFWKGTGVYDVVRVSTPYLPSDGQVAIVTGGVLNQPVGLLSHVPTVEPEEVVGSLAMIQVDVPEAETIKAHIVDYAVLWIWYDRNPWPTEVLIAHTKKPLRPGNSGGPVYT